MSQQTSGFRGVYRRPNKRWQAQIYLKGKCHNLGCFDDEVSAAHAYDRAAKEAVAVPVLNFHEDGTLNPARMRRMLIGVPKTSRFRGVCSIGSGQWKAQIALNRRTWSLGVFPDEREAAKAYDRAAKRYRGWAYFNFPDDEACDVPVQPPAMEHQMSGGAVEEDLCWSISDEDEDGREQQSGGAVPPCKRGRSSSEAVAKTSLPSPTAAAAPATHGQSPIDLTLENNDPGEELEAEPSDTSAFTAERVVSTSTPPASSATPASLASSAAAASTSSRHGGHASKKSTGDAVEQLYHAVMKARMDARDTKQKAVLKKACTLFNDVHGCWLLIHASTASTWRGDSPQRRMRSSASRDAPSRTPSGLWT